MAWLQSRFAGRSVPSWAAIAIWLLIAANLAALLIQFARVPPAEPAPPPVVAPAKARVAPASPPAPVRLALDRGLQHCDYAWNDAGVPPGRIAIEIDLAAQTLSVFRANHEIGRAAILYGTDENPTPTGTFRILEKDIDHVSNLYEAAMPYMLRLTNDGVAIHGSQVVYGRASRGCIGVPDEFAALLFREARIGDRVTIRGSTPAAQTMSASPPPTA